MEKKEKDVFRMQLKRLGLGARFEFPDARAEEEMRRFVFERLFSILTVSDLEGLSLYGGLDASAPTGETVYIAVIMGGKLKRMRRIYDAIRRDTALGTYLCRSQPFWENNRLAAMPPPLCFGQVGPDGRLTGGDTELGLCVPIRPARRRSLFGHGKAGAQPPAV